MNPRLRNSLALLALLALASSGFHEAVFADVCFSGAIVASGAWVVMRWGWPWTWGKEHAAEPPPEPPRPAPPPPPKQPGEDPFG